MKLSLLGTAILIRNGRYFKRELFSLFFLRCPLSIQQVIFWKHFLAMNLISFLFRVQIQNLTVVCYNYTFFTNVSPLMHWSKCCIYISFFNFTCLSCSSHLILGSEVMFFGRSLALHRRPSIQIVVSIFIKIRKIVVWGK